MEVKPFPLMTCKTNLIDMYFKKPNHTSFADLGGVWGVEAGYTFYTLQKYKITKGYLFDEDIHACVKTEANQYSQLELHEMDFRSPKAVEKIPHVDAIFLFYILLHQVNPNWDELLKMYAPKTDAFLIVAPQWDGEKTIRLFDLGKDEYFKQVPHEPTYGKHYPKLFGPQHHEVENVSNIWQWGITDKDLIDVMHQMDFHLTFYAQHEQWGKSRFMDTSFIFERRKPEN